MLWEKLNLEKLLNDSNNGSDDEENEKSTWFIPVFYVSILLALCIAFIEIKLIVITLFAPAMIVMMWKPPFKNKKRLFRIILFIYLLFLTIVTIWWFQG